MFKKLLAHKAYLFIGTLLTAGIITGISYNVIIADSQKEQIITVSSIDTNEVQSEKVASTENYEELKNCIVEMQSKIEELETKVRSLDEETSTKNNTIENLQTKINYLEKQNKTKDSQINSLSEKMKSIEENDIVEEDTNLKDEVSKLREEMDRVLKFIHLAEEEGVIRQKSVTLDLESLLYGGPIENGTLKILLGEEVIENRIIQPGTKKHIISVSGRGKKQLSVYFEGSLRYRTIVDFNSKEENITVS